MSPVWTFDTEPDVNVRKVVETLSNLTEGTLVEPIPVQV